LTLCLRNPKLVLDVHDRIVTVLVGTPEDPEWPKVVEKAMRAMRRARRSGFKRRVFRKKDLHHRCGEYLALTTGVSFGGGRQRPGNLVAPRKVRRIIGRLLRNKYVRRVAGFQSSALATYAPKLFRYYCDTMREIFRRQPGLRHNFSNSVFPAATFNCGPEALTYDHRDYGNWAAGFCTVTSGGKFDHTKGADLYLKQLRLIIESPSYSTLLIPSGCMDHGNTPLQPGETRCSMTQYAAGGLFQWVTYGHQTPGGAEKKAEIDGPPGSRWKWALNLLSKYDELEADRAAVFGHRTSAPSTSTSTNTSPT
ncbi:hypothetical protein C8J57DRAFT_1084447, partial [Mycena rebaudengoi]